MKDIKSYVIGFLSCACMFLIMGQTIGNEEIEQMIDMTNQMREAGLMPKIGRYQAISANKYESFYLLDTGTGAVYTQIENPNKNTYKKRLADVWRRSPYVYEFTNSRTP